MNVIIQERQLRPSLQTHCQQLRGVGSVDWETKGKLTDFEQRQASEEGERRRGHIVEGISTPSPSVRQNLEAQAEPWV